MRISLVLAFVGLSAAAPAIVKDVKSGSEEVLLQRYVLPDFLTDGFDWRSIHVERLAETAGGEASVTATFATTSTRTSLSTSTSTLTTAAPTSTTTRTAGVASTQVATTTKTQTQAATTPAPATTKTPITTSTKTTSAAPTTSAPSDSDSDSEDEADVSMDTDLDDFLHLELFSHLAQKAPTPPPFYALVFSNQNATAIHQPIETHSQSVYSTEECATHCTAHLACRAFGLYIERQPSCANCTHPRSVVANMCELYNTPLEQRIITDEGREQRIRGQKFARAVRASNGYNRLGHAVLVTTTVTRTVTASRQVQGLDATRFGAVVATARSSGVQRMMARGTGLLSGSASVGPSTASTKTPSASPALHSVSIRDDERWGVGLWTLRERA